MHSPCNSSSGSPLPDCRPCHPCGSNGEYMSGGNCVHGNATDPGQRTCSACKSCTSGSHRLTNPCPPDGRSLVDTVQCIACSPCGPGQFINRSCDGVTAQDRTCAACKNCSRGFYRQGCQNGTGRADNVVCLPCLNCSSGNVVDKPCSGLGFSADDRVCKPCFGACKTGEFISASCSGTSTTEDAQCSACTQSCPVGTYIQQGCPGTLTWYSCIYCDFRLYVFACDGKLTWCMGREQAPQCATCLNECQDNFYLAKPCSGKSVGTQVLLHLKKKRLTWNSGTDVKN